MQSEDDKIDRRERRKTFWTILRWGLGLFLLLFSFPRLGFLGAFLVLLGAILIAPEIAALLSQASGNLLMPSRHSAPKPIYSIPESRLVEGKVQDAIREYEAIIEAFPEEVKPFIELINIAARHLDDPNLAHRYHEKGLELLPPKKAQAELSQYYKQVCEKKGWNSAAPLPELGSELRLP